MSYEIKLTVTGLVYNQSVVGTYGLVLSEEYGTRRFSVMIGEPEAQSIALKLNNKVSARPLTHDLIKNLLYSLGADLQKVLIYDMINDVFYSELYIQNGEKTIVVDARTSDAVALAVRCESPIYIKSDILDVVGMDVASSDKEEESKPDVSSVDLAFLDEANLRTFSKQELDELLERSVNDEKYELAALIRDILKQK